MSKKQNKQVEVAPTIPENEDLDNDDLDISEDEEGGTRIGGIYIPPPIKPYCSTESKGPRLIITKIVNTNFKSYAGTVEVGPFHHRFSAVMGPNGSGKSNVIDSMLFVFGCRAGKIRAKTFKSMIHKSSKYPNVRSCKVAVHFAQVLDKEDGSHDIVPNTEFAIARTATIDSKSHYTIDGREVNFKAVAALLSGFGVDLKYNRFLILQGEVEQISLMKPKAINENENGLLEYLEDIIGTSRYKRPLHLLSERLEKFNEERTDKHNRCRLAERDMKELEEPRNVAVEYLKLENKLFYNLNIYYQKHVFDKKKSIEQITEDKNKILEELKEHDAKFEELKKERMEKEALINEEIKKHESMCTKKEEFKSMLHKAKGARERTHALMLSTNNRRKDLKKQIGIDEKKLEEYKTLPEKNQKEIDESEHQIEKLNKQKTDLENELTENLSKIEDETRPLREEIDPLETKLASLKTSLDECKAIYTVTEKELAIIKSDEVNEMRKYESLKYSYEESLTNLKEKQSQLKECEQVVPETKKTIAENSKKIQHLREEEVKKTAELEQLKLKIDENVQTEHSRRTNNRVLNALMQQRQNGKIPGILGRLGDLGGIDAKYDVAISTCCGRLDNIVVDTVATAQKCIEFLKAHNSGRATFISLEKVEYLNDVLRQPIQTPENVHRLFDLIRVEDERVLPAFYFSLHDTLVANDLEQGTRIAYGKERYRVVTLAGDVIEISGTMSGGGHSQMRGKMGQKVQTKTTNVNSSFSEKDIENLQLKAEQMRNHIYDLQFKRQELENETRALEKNLQIKEQEYNKLVCQIKSLTVQLPRVEESVKKQQEKAENTKSDPAKVKELEEMVKNAKSDYDKKQAEVDVIQKNVDELTARIKEITDTKVKSVRVKIEKVSKQIDKLTANISKLSVEIRTTERNVQKITEKINNANVEIEEAENSMRRMSEERDQFDKDVEELEKKFEEITKEIEAATKDSSSIKKEIAAIHKQESDGKMVRLEIEEKIKTVDKKLQDENKAIPAWENKRKQLKLHEIPMETITPLKIYTEEQLEGRKLEDINYEITQLEAQAENKPNLGIIDEYNQKRELYLERVRILEEITMKRNEIREGFDAVKKKRYTEFNEGFAIISRKLKEMYQMITLGGDAELELVDTMDPFSEGIVFSVRPPKKSWKVITNLSGGEKTLSSLALVFALHYYKPSPLYFMDEIDAALDFKNVSIVANYINERTKNAQFIIISLRSNMFELADRLVGIYKTYDCTQSVTIDNIDKSREVRVVSVNNHKNLERPENSENIQITQSDLNRKEPMEIDDGPVQPDPFDAVKNASQVEN